METMKFVFELLTALLALAILLILFFTVGKDVFPWLFPTEDVTLRATRGTASLECAGGTHVVRVDQLGIAYRGHRGPEAYPSEPQEIDAFPVVIWGDKVKAPDNVEYVTLYPVDEGDNVYDLTFMLIFDAPGPEGVPDFEQRIPGADGPSELLIAFVERNGLCRTLADDIQPPRIVDNVVKYTIDFRDFAGQCAGKLKNLGVVRTAEPIMLSCGGSEPIR